MSSHITTALIESQKLTEKIETLLFETGGELNEELEGLLQFSLDQQEGVKAIVDQYALTLDRIDSLGSHYSKQAMAIARILEGLEAAKTRIELNVKSTMQTMGIDSLKGHELEFKIRNNPASVDILDESLIPPEFTDLVMTTKIKKNEIKDALKDGKEVPGARLIQRQSLKFQVARPELKSKGV